MNDQTLSGLTRRPDFYTGQMIGIYKLEERLGAGAMGEVWKAWDTQGKRWVAVKFLPPEFRNNEEAADQMLQAFQVSEQLTHPNLCQTIGFVNDQDFGPYLVMAYIPGITLSRYRRQFHGLRLSLEKVIQILTPVAEALDYAHNKIIHTQGGDQCGILHRDIKPGNILLQLKEEKDETIAHVCIIDLGLAAEIQTTTTGFTRSRPDTAGTLPYMPPEQLSGKRSQWDGKLDQYALAVVAYELLAGRTPLEHKSFELMLNAIKHETPDSVLGVPAASNAALLRALSKDKKNRYGSCQEFLGALRSGASNNQGLELEIGLDKLHGPIIALKELARLTDTSPFTALTVSPDGNTVVAGNENRKVHYWQTPSHQINYVEVTHPISGLSFSPDGKRLCVVGSTEKKERTFKSMWYGLTHWVYWWDYHYCAYYTVLNSLTHERRLLRALDNVEATNVSFSPDGAQLILIAKKSLVVVDSWSNAEDHELRQYREPREWLKGWDSFSFSSDQQLVLVVGYADVLAVNIPNGSVRQRLKFTSESGFRKGVIMSCPPKHVSVIVETSSGLQLWSMESGKKILEFPDSSGVISLAISPDGSRLLTTGKSLRLWDVGSGGEICSVNGSCSKVAFASDGGCAAVLSGNSLILYGLPN